MALDHLSAQERDAIIAGLHLLKLHLINTRLQHGTHTFDLLTNGGTHEGLQIKSVESLADQVIDAYPSPAIAQPSYPVPVDAKDFRALHEIAAAHSQSIASASADEPDVSRHARLLQCAQTALARSAFYMTDSGEVVATSPDSSSGKEHTIDLVIRVKTLLAPGAVISEFVEDLDYTITSQTPGVSLIETEITSADDVRSSPERQRG